MRRCTTPKPRRKRSGQPKQPDPGVRQRLAGTRFRAGVHARTGSQGLCARQPGRRGDADGHVLADHRQAPQRTRAPDGQPRCRGQNRAAGLRSRVKFARRIRPTLQIRDRALCESGAGIRRAARLARRFVLPAAVALLVPRKPGPARATRGPRWLQAALHPSAKSNSYHTSVQSAARPCCEACRRRICKEERCTRNKRNKNPLAPKFR
jgi:hypothetical protein